MSITIQPERPDTADAALLIQELDALLTPNYPDESRHGYSIEKLLRQDVYFYVVRHEGRAAGCGGIQFFEESHGLAFGEVKRMYVRPDFRGLGLARRVLMQLEEAASAQGVKILRLETGIHQQEAVRLYERWGFRRIGPFGEYHEDPLSLFFEKHLD